MSKKKPNRYIGFIIYFDITVIFFKKEIKII